MNLKIFALAAIAAAALRLPKPVSADINVTVGEFSQLMGWQNLCALGVNQTHPQLFFEMFFRPVLMLADTSGLFIGYFEPELDGALQLRKRFRYPIYNTLTHLPNGRPCSTRRQIETQNPLSNQVLEITWVKDPVNPFFRQLQGSGQVCLPEGQVIILGYGGFNIRPYKSLGAELARRVIYERYQVLAQFIQNWVNCNSIAGRNLMRHSLCYVFCREILDLPAHTRPLGAMNRSHTLLRFLIIDPDFVPLGLPVWLEKQDEKLLNPLWWRKILDWRSRDPRGEHFHRHRRGSRAYGGKNQRCWSEMLVLKTRRLAYAALLEQGT